MERKQHAMEKNEERPDKCSCRGRRLTDNLHECLSGQTDCQNLYSFGKVNYCCTLLKNWTD
jgi:hypothetical protein